jgi:hypothetical protein
LSGGGNRLLDMNEDLIANLTSKDRDASGRNYVDFEATSPSTACLTSSFVHPEPESILINNWKFSAPKIGFWRDKWMS